MARRYQKKPKAMLRLVRHIEAEQAKNGVAPTSHRAIGKAIGTSHAQVSRLLQEAEAGGILRKASPEALRYEVILQPPTLPGIVRIPKVACRWQGGIRWVDSPTESVWLDRSVYKIEDPAEHWALTFPEPPRDGVTPNLRLNENALALVHRCDAKALKEGFWYVVEYDGLVIICSLLKKAGVYLVFRCGAGDTAPNKISRGSITSLAEVMMVTTRPPLPPPQ